MITTKIFNFKFLILNFLVLALVLPGVVRAEDASRPGKIKNFPRAALGKVQLSAISGSVLTVGDSLKIVGRWTDETKTAMEACVVRNLSIQKIRGTFVGDVVSMSDTGFVMTTVSEARQNQTVTVGVATKIVNRKEVAIALSDIQVGHRIRVKGLWNKTNNAVTEVTHVKDYNLPEKQVKNETE